MLNLTFAQNLPFPHFGLMSLSAVLQKHAISQSLIITNLEKKPARAILETEADLLAFYCYSGFFEKILQICKEVKANRKNTLVIVGGPHPTFSPEIINEEGIDMVCLGEGEGAMEELCSKLINGQEISHIPNLWVKNSKGINKNEIRPLIDDLDSLPMYNYSLYDQYPQINSSGELRVLGSRGCAYNCAYCHNQFMRKMYKKKGKWFRSISPEKLVDQIEVHTKKLKIKKIDFADDLWGTDKEWLTSFAKEYKKRINLPYFVSIRPNLVTEHTIGLLADSGCYCLSMGIESGNYNIRRQIMNRDITNDQILKAARIIKKHGIKLRTTSIMGLPGETYQEAVETVSVNIQAGSDYGMFYVAQPYPGTDLKNYAIEKGFLEKNIRSDSYDLLSLFDTPIRQIDPRVLRLHRFATFLVLFPFLFVFVKLIVQLPVPETINRLVTKFALAIIYKKTHQISFLVLFKHAMAYSKNLGRS